MEEVDCVRLSPIAEYHKYTAQFIYAFLPIKPLSPGGTVTESSWMLTVPHLQIVGLVSMADLEHDWSCSDAYLQTVLVRSTCLLTFDTCMFT